jgi:hypothetical protein
MTLSRTVTAIWMRMLWWKHIRDFAQKELDHYDDLWLKAEDFEDAVKQSAEPKLLGGQ